MVPDVSMPPFTFNLPDVICMGPLLSVLQPVAPNTTAPERPVSAVPKYKVPVVCAPPTLIDPVVEVWNNLDVAFEILLI